ncbi:MAG: Ig-like domain repeat protein [Candidatus Acidiferrales bacterium]
MQNRVQLLRTYLLAAAVLFLPFAAFAQTSNIQPRITAAVNESQLTTLRGNTHPYAQGRFDRGAAPDSLPMARMMLVLKRSAAQEAALDTLLDQQQDSSSPNYHAWLTPQQFGQEFGPADADIQTIVQWLASHGFQVNGVSNGRTVIEFSGTAGQVRDAFHTEIHRYNVNNEDHWANASDPQIPTALTPVVAGVDTLYNFPRHAMHHVSGEVSRSQKTGKLEPTAPSLFTFGGNQCGVPGLACYGVTPYDFATIYNVLPLWSATPATDGSGETIAIVAETDIALSDISNFRNYFALPVDAPTIILDGPDPGTVPGDETESDLDVEWAGAVAKGAKIDFVESATTEASLGVDLSAQYVVDNNLAGILSESYGICEFFLGSAGNQFYNQLWQQASAQGITALVATGDSGSAVCDRNAGNTGAAELGLSVNGIGSTPYNIAVGGTDFFDLTNVSTYWSPTNTVPPGAPAGTPASLSALSYIPETTWNDSCTNAVFENVLRFTGSAENNCNNAQLISEGFVTAVGGSGGKSNCTTYDGTNPLSCTGGYAKPSWQTGSGTTRSVPDVSLFAASGSPSGAFYLVCEADTIQAGYTSCDSADPSTLFEAVGGTSASTPSFAGIMALVEQKTGSRQGNANYILYKLAAQSGASCNSTGTLGTNCVFYDVTNGTIAMPCATGSPNCNTSNPGDQFGVLSGYATTSGYDLATGLGSVNANNLVKAWTTANTALKASTTTLTLNSGNAVNITHGQSVPVSIGVTGTPGTPTGNVSLIANTGPNGTQGVQGFTLSSGSATGTTNALPGGTYTVVAQYAGDATFGASSSATTSVTVGKEASSENIALELFNASTGQQTSANATTAQYGSSELLRMNVTSQAGDACAQNAPGQMGCPTGSITVTNNGAALDGGSFALNSLGYAEDQSVQLPGGADAVKVSYAGDNSFNASSATSTITITPAPTAAYVNVVSGPDIIWNASNMLEANVPGVPLGVAPTGLMTLYCNGTQVGSPVALTGTLVGSTPVAEATFTTTQLPLGNDAITVQYGGDNNYASSTSAPATADVQILTNLSLRTSSATINHGASVTFTATLSATQSGGPAPTGAVWFYQNSNFITSVPLSGGQAQLTTSSLPGGNLYILASYTGDTNYRTSQNSLSETVNLLPTVTSVMSSSPTIQQGSDVTFTAAVAPVQSGGPALTGSVQFFWAVNLQGADNPIGGPVALVNGQAKFDTSTLPTNTGLVGASYGGDNNYAGSSGTISQTVTPAPTFMVTANPMTIPVSAPGGSGSTVVTFTAQNGFSSNGAVTVTPMCSGLPSETSCSSGASITIPANGTAMATVTFLTTAPSAVVPASRNRPIAGGWKLTTGALALACLLCSMMLALGHQGRRRGWGIALVFTVFALLAVSVGCGGGSGGGGGGGGGGNPGTPIGVDSSVSVTVTINGVTQTISGLTLNVE